MAQNSPSDKPPALTTAAGNPVADNQNGGSSTFQVDLRISGSGAASR